MPPSPTVMQRHLLRAGANLIGRDECSNRLTDQAALDTLAKPLSQTVRGACQAAALAKSGAAFVDDSERHGAGFLPFLLPQVRRSGTASRGPREPRSGIPALARTGARLIRRSMQAWQLDHAASARRRRVRLRGDRRNVASCTEAHRAPASINLLIHRTPGRLYQSHSNRPLNSRLGSDSDAKSAEPSRPLLRTTSFNAGRRSRRSRYVDIGCHGVHWLAIGVVFFETLDAIQTACAWYIACEQLS